VNDGVNLLPPIALINEQLTRNERERRRLRTLLKLAIEEADERSEGTREQAARPEAASRQGGGA
jgi:hypothetical protein